LFSELFRREGLHQTQRVQVCASNIPVHVAFDPLTRFGGGEGVKDAERLTVLGTSLVRFEAGMLGPGGPTIPANEQAHDKGIADILDEWFDVQDTLEAAKTSIEPISRDFFDAFVSEIQIVEEANCAGFEVFGGWSWATHSVRWLCEALVIKWTNKLCAACVPKIGGFVSE